LSSSRAITAARPKGYYYAANRFAAPEHGGTHLDAPIHFAEAKPTAEQVDLNRLVGEAAVVDVAKACEQDPDYQVSIADLQGWEERNRRQRRPPPHHRLRPKLTAEASVAEGPNDPRSIAFRTTES